MVSPCRCVGRRTAEASSYGVPPRPPNGAVVRHVRCSVHRLRALEMPAYTLPVRLLNASWFVWLLLALPGIVLTYRYARGTTFYGEYLHATGELGVRLLMLAMAMTPLKLMFANAGWVRWLARRRRYIG